MIPGLSEATIRSQANDSSYQRGREYYRSGAVDNLLQRGNVIYAEVEGSDYEPYTVSLTFDAGGLRTADCTCPYDYGGWCKHIVAVALTCLHQPQLVESRQPLAALLADLTRDQLLHLLQRLAENEPALVDAVEQQVAQLKLTRSQPASTAAATAGAASHRPSIDAQSYRRQVSRLIGGLSHMRSSEAYWQVGGTVNQVRELLGKATVFLNNGDPENALAVYEAVVDEYVKSWFEMDDSDGEAGDLFSDLDEPLAAILLSAALPAKERQRWLRQLDRWAGEVEDYGVDEPFSLTRELLAQGRTLEDLLADQNLALPWVNLLLKVLDRRGDTDGYLQLAKQNGLTLPYTQKLVALGRTAEAVSYALTHLQQTSSALALAQNLRQQGALTEALAVGERGLALDGNKSSLATWLRDLAQSLGKSELALAAAQAALRDDVSLASYQGLQAVAGVHWHTSVRAEALAHVRSVSAATGSSGAIAIFLHEGLLDEAIALVDRKGSYVGYELLGQVVEAAIPVQPDWAIRHALQQATPIIDAGKADHYHYAVEWLRRARDAWRASGRSHEWQGYLNQLRGGPHGRKYKLMELLRRIS